MVTLINKTTGQIATPNANATPEQIAAAKAQGFVEQEPTAGSVYKPYSAPGTDNPAQHRTYVAQNGNVIDDVTGEVVSHNDFNAVDEDAIRNRVLNTFQKEIDATNDIYSGKLQEAKTAGIGRLGSSRATQARSGLLGSDFGAAQTDKVNEQNTSIENLLLAEKGQKIAEILGRGNSAATAEIVAKRQAQEKGLDEYLKYLGAKTETKKTNLAKVAGSLLDQKLTPNDLDPKQLADLAASYGVSTGDIINSYNAEKRVRDEAQNKLNTEGQKEKFDQDLKTKQLALDTAYKNGSLSIDRYNAETSRINAESAKFKAGLDANGNPIAGGASQVKTDALKSATDLLTKFDTGKGTSAVGKSRVLTGGYTVPGTDARDFEVQFKNLKSLLSLDNVKLLKGQGAVSDAERALLAEASAKLDLAQSEPEFRAALVDIKNALSGTVEGNAGQTIKVKINATGQTGTVNASEFDPATMTKI